MLRALQGRPRHACQSTVRAFLHTPGHFHGHSSPPRPLRHPRRGWRSGAGPEHLLQAGLTTHLHRNGHFVADVQVIEDDAAQSPAEIRTAFELARRLAAGVRVARAAGRFPLVLSGNCNSAIGTLSGLLPAPRAIFWFDAHGDCNTPETTASGFLENASGEIRIGRTTESSAEKPRSYRVSREGCGRRAGMFMIARAVGLG